MALCSTGCMSMGGSDAPRSINCELGVPGSSTICLNSPTVRSLAQVPAGAISLCNFYGKSAAPPFALDYLVIAGGGAQVAGGFGGQARLGAGSGAGGVLCGTIGTSCVACFKTSIPVIVGGGGSFSRGSQSCFGCFITACGGGGGGTYDGFGGGSDGQSGGSGGGGRQGAGGGCAVNNCAEGREGGSGGGGGGGKCAAGSSFSPSRNGGSGGTFCLNQMFGKGPLQGGNYYIGGGGGGGSSNLGGAAGAGGLGGGGSGGPYQNPITSPAVCGLPGQANTGGGGGGNGGFDQNYSAPGGSGAVFIRYPDAYTAACVTGCVLGCCVGGYRAFFFCGSGTFCIP